MDVTTRIGYAQAASVLKGRALTYGAAGFDGARSGEDEKLMDACREFESVFLSILLKESKAVPRAGQFDGVRAEHSAFSDMLADELGKEMARGGGIGLAEILYKELARAQAARPSAKTRETEGAGK